MNAASLLLIIALILAALGRATAQDSTPAAPAPVANKIVVDDSLSVAIGTSYSDNNIHGFGKAEVLDVDGKKHFVWVPIKPMGFHDYLPFYRNEAEARRFRHATSGINVDKVVSIRINGLYQEHMIVKGKRKHLIATRLVDGPVELFNYTATESAGAMTPVGVDGGIPDRQWFLRRAGQDLVKVERLAFVEQMMVYFHDYPQLVAALYNCKLRYRDMVTVVNGYNGYLSRPKPTDSSGSK